MHRKKPINVLTVLPPPERMTLSEVEGDLDLRASNPAPGLLPIYSTFHSEQEEAAYQCEKKNNFVHAISLMHEALLSRAQTVSDLPGAHSVQVDCNSRFCQVLYSWAFHFVRDGQLDRAFDSLKLLTQVTSHKGVLKFKGKKKYRFKTLLLHAWYYSKISKHNAAYDYLASCKTRATISQFDLVLLALVEGFVLSNLDRVKEAIKSHSEARDRLESLSRSFSDIDDRGYYISLAVSLHNLAADHCNLYQPKEASPYIKAAGNIAAQYLPDGLLLRDKINSLHEELFRSPISYPSQFKPGDSDKASELISEYRSVSPAKERRSNSRPPIIRRNEQMKNTDWKSKGLSCQFVRKSRKSPSSGRSKAANAKEPARPTSSSIGPVSPVASKSSSAKPHRRRKVDSGYKEAENLLRKKMEAMETNPNEREVPESQSREFRSITSAWKRSRDAMPQLLKSFKIRIALQKCLELTHFYSNMRVWAKSYWWRRNARELIFVVKSVASKKNRDLARFQAVQKRLQAVYATVCRLAVRLYLRTEIARVAFAIRLCKRHVAAAERTRKLALAYVSVFNRENTAEMKQILRRTDARMHFHTVDSRVEVRDMTPDLSIILISDGSLYPPRPPLFSPEWFTKASSVTSLYQRCGQSRATTAMRHWQVLIASEKSLSSRRTQSAVRIQACWRKRVGSQAFGCLRTAAIRIQRYFREWRTRKRTSAAEEIQKSCRVFLTRSRAQRLNQAAVAIQKRYRGFIVRKENRKRQWAAKVLQKAFRRYYRRPYVLQA